MLYASVLREICCDLIHIFIIRYTFILLFILPDLYYIAALQLSHYRFFSLTRALPEFLIFVFSLLAFAHQNSAFCVVF